MPPEYASCIQEWTRLHPGWDIRRWDESNSPLELPYLRNAREHGKWANMSNLVRFHALEQEGGIYLDTDMKVIRPLDPLLDNACFLGFEEGQEGDPDFWVNNAIVGAEPHHPFIRQCRDTLLARFDGLESANLSAPQLVTSLLKEQYGLSRYGYQVLQGITLYPVGWFYPVHYKEAVRLQELDHHIRPETLAVHLWGRSWLSTQDLIRMLDQLQHEFNGLEARYSAFRADLDQALQGLAGTLAIHPEEPVPAQQARTPREAIEGILTLIRGAMDRSNHHFEYLAGQVRYLQAHSRLAHRLQQEQSAGVRRELDEAVEALSARMDRFLAREAACQENLARLSGQIAGLQRDNAVLQAELAQAREGIRQRQKAFDQQEAQLLSRIDLLSGDRMFLQGEIRSRDARLEESKTQFRKLLAQFNALGAEKLQLAARQEQQDRTLKHREEELAARHTENGKLASRLAAAERDREELAARLGGLQQEYAAYRQQQDLNNAELVRLLQERKAAIEQSIQWYKKTYADRRLIGIIKDRLIRGFK